MPPDHHEDPYGRELAIGSHHYRAFVGPPNKYDIVSAMQFNLLTALGLREHHYLLDVGCGSLRGGRLFIPYLLPDRYFGIEPEHWLLEEGIEKELGKDLVNIKRPVFSHVADFTLSIFRRKFDFILAQSIFSHASQAQVRICLSEAKLVMRPACIFAATFFEGETNYSGDEWSYPDMVTYTLQHMIELAKEQDLVCRPLGWSHPNRQTWVVFVHPENKRDFSQLGERPKQNGPTTN